jgi:hypothetical protein
MPAPDDDARVKLDPRLVRWLEGESAESVGLPTDSQGRVRVIVRFSEPPWDERVERLYALGVEVEGGEAVADGAVDAAALTALVRDETVAGVGPIQAARIPPNPARQLLPED